MKFVKFTFKNGDEIVIDRYSVRAHLIAKQDDNIKNFLIICLSNKDETEQIEIIEDQNQFISIMNEGTK